MCFRAASRRCCRPGTGPGLRSTGGGCADVSPPVSGKAARREAQVLHRQSHPLAPRIIPNRMDLITSRTQAIVLP